MSGTSNGTLSIHNAFEASVSLQGQGVLYMDWVAGDKEDILLLVPLEVF